MGLTVQPAAHFPIEELAALWNAVYEGYWFNVQHTPAQLARRFTATDVDLSASVILLDAGVPVGFSVLGLRDGRGWIGGFGTVPRVRRTGLGHRLVEAQLEAAESRATRGIQLEVLEQNPARLLYAAHGFEARRRLAILVGQATPPTPHAIALRPMPLDAMPLTAEPPPGPAWQREAQALLRHADAAAAAYTVDREGAARGHILVERAGAMLRLQWLHVDPAMLDDVLLAIRQLAGVESVLLVNEPEGSPLHTAAVRGGWDTIGWQLEMVRPPGA